MADVTLASGELIQIIGYVATLAGGAWALRSSIANLKEALVTQITNLSTEVKLLQQAQASTTVGLEHRFSNVSSAMEQQREHLSRLQQQQDQAVRHIIEIQARLQAAEKEGHPSGQTRLKD